MLTLPAPAPEALDGERLRAELAVAGIADVDVRLVGDELVFPDLAVSHRSMVEGALSRHMSRPGPPDADAEFRQALEAATTVAALRDALLGKTGPGAEPRRPDGR